MPVTRRVPSERTSLTALAAAQRPRKGSINIPVGADQK